MVAKALIGGCQGVLVVARVLCGYYVDTRVY